MRNTFCGVIYVRYAGEQQLIKWDVELDFYFTNRLCDVRVYLLLEQKAQSEDVVWVGATNKKHTACTSNFKQSFKNHCFRFENVKF